MRTRKEIEKDVNLFNRSAADLEVRMIEILLDIRDLLLKKKKAKPNYGVGLVSGTKAVALSLKKGMRR